MRPVCAVHTCTNVGKHLMPLDPILRKEWVMALRLDVVKKTDWPLKKYEYICSDHFKPTDFITSPPFFEGDLGTIRLKNRSIPSVFPWTAVENYILPDDTLTSARENINLTRHSSELPRKTYGRTERPLRFVEEIPFTLSEPDTEKNPLKLENEEYYEDIKLHDYLELCDGPEQSYSDQVTSSHLQFDNVNVKELTEVAVQTCDVYEPPLFSSQIYKNSNRVIHFYTGLENYEKAQLVFNSLGQCVTRLKYTYGPPPKIDPFEQFFMILIILRQNKTFEEISMMYIIPIEQVLNIFVTWVRFLSSQWRKLDLWQDKSTVETYVSLDFHNKNPNTRVVKGATERPIKKPGLPMARRRAFSNYKNRNTIKALIGIAPSGLITYVSPCYGGSASGQQIIEQRELLQQSNYNDEIKVESGLNICFFQKGNQIGPDTLRETQRGASKRVHIERVIGQMKTYKILTQPRNRTENLLSSDIVFICAMLVNFN